MAQTNFYIRKGAHEIRHWLTPASEAPSLDERLEVRLRQRPAQGWARLFVTSPHWDVLRRAPIYLDWGTLPVDPRSEAEILATLRGPRPGIPLRVRYDAHIGLWDGTLRWWSVGRALDAFMTRRDEGLAGLARVLATSFRLAGGPTVFAVSTDGNLPTSIDAAIRTQFHEAIVRIGEDLMRQIRNHVVIPNNDALRCLTWIFALCPEAVQREMVEAFKALRSGGLHPLLIAPHAARVVVQGLGRVVTDPVTLCELIPELCADMQRQDSLAALSSLLSRPEATPRILDRALVHAIVRGVTGLLEQLNRDRAFRVKLKYALLVVGGVLRVRVSDPWALLASRSAQAEDLRRTLTKTADLMQCIPRPTPNQLAKLKAIGELIAFLSGADGRPDILSFVDSITDD